MLTPYDRNSFPYSQHRSYVVYLPSISVEANSGGINFPCVEGVVDGRQLIPAVSNLENARTRKLESTKECKNEDDDLSSDCLWPRGDSGLR
jgi:hypothetical protein